jgi:hypothetical protein
LIFLAVIAVAGGRGMAAGTPSGQAPPDHQPAAETLVLPANVSGDIVHQTFLTKLLKDSPTFRNQCRRLAAATQLQVRVLVDDEPRRDITVNGRTAMTYKGGVLISAHVYLRPSPRVMEFIAHELEHIIEQLDGVDLAAEAGKGAVWKSGTGRFETRRAIEIGRRVATEIHERRKRGTRP